MIKKVINQFLSILSSEEHDKQRDISHQSSKTSVKQTAEENKTRPVQKESPKKTEPKWDISHFNVPPAEGEIRFHDLKIPVNIMRAIADLDFKYCTPVQAQILPRALSGMDATGQAQTGTGKSAAFLITILTLLFTKPIKGKRKPGIPRALILAPTRELALQIEKDAIALGKYIRSSTLAVFGGMGYEKQKNILRNNVTDIVVATPGRLLDFQRQRLIDLSRVEILVIDEADRMLDMGFIPDIRNIVYSVPPKKERQTMFFSATITPEVENLSRQWTKSNAFSVIIAPETVAADSIRQVVYIVTTDDKFTLLFNLIKKYERVLVFANRRDETRELMEKLRDYDVGCDLLSGEVPQKKRLKVLDKFKSGKINVLVATDVAARGLHVEDINLVVNYNLSTDPEDYVHRIGRTGRAGNTGTSVSFACEYDSYYLPDIEKFLKDKLRCEHPPKELLIDPPEPVMKKKKKKKSSSPKKKFHVKKNKKNFFNKNKSQKYQSKARHQRGRHSGKKKTG